MSNQAKNNKSSPFKQEIKNVKTELKETKQGKDLLKRLKSTKKAIRTEAQYAVAVKFECIFFDKKPKDLQLIIGRITRGFPRIEEMETLRQKMSKPMVQETSESESDSDDNSDDSGEGDQRCTVKHGQNMHVFRFDKPQVIQNQPTDAQLIQQSSDWLRNFQQSNIRGRTPKNGTKG